MRSPFYVSVALVASLAVAGCSKKGGDAGGSSCDAAIGKAVDTMMSARKDTPQASMMSEIAGKLRGVLVERCTEDKWSEQVVTCFSNASDFASIKECEKGLTPEQNQHRQAAVMKVMMAGRMGGPGMGGPGMGGPGLGGPAAMGRMGGAGGPGMGGPGMAGHPGMAPPAAGSASGDTAGSATGSAGSAAAPQ